MATGLRPVDGLEAGRHTRECEYLSASISTLKSARRIARFLEGVQGFAPEARWVRPESLHITLKFIGEQTPEQVEAITSVCGG